jgi:hypothetical protein
MAFSRSPLPEMTPDADQLTARMAGIGMNFAVKPEPDADIESTLLHASVLGMEEGDFRVLAVLTTWLGIHHPRVNADRLVRLVGAYPSERVRAYWAAVSTWLKKDRRLTRLAVAFKGPPLELLPTGTSFQIQRRGEDPRFIGSKLRVPKGTLRDRKEDVLPPETLIRRHAGYRNRVLMGPSFRADVWTAIEQSPELSIADVARRASCSFATAWQAAQDFRLLVGAGENATLKRAPRSSTMR